MTQEVYKQMLDVMKSRRGAYAGMDIPEFYEMVEELFTPEEAEVNNVLTTKPTTAANVAKEMNKGQDQITAILNLDRCFGCAVCATGCPSEAIVMESKSDFPVPPKNPNELITSLKASFAKQN